MTDAVTPAILASSISTGVGVIIFGIDTGLDYATLIAGILGASAALSYLKPDKIGKRAYEVITASLLAGYASPVFANAIMHKAVKWDLTPIGVQTSPALQLLLAFLVAFVAHGALLPGIRKLLENTFKRYTP